MNQIEFDAASLRLKAAKKEMTAQVAKERRADLHGNNKVLNYITLMLERTSASDTSHKILSSIKEMVAEGYRRREEMRKEREEKIERDYYADKADLLKDYGEWAEGRKSNRQAVAERWRQQHQPVTYIYEEQEP